MTVVCARFCEPLQSHTGKVRRFDEDRGRGDGGGVCAPDRGEAVSALLEMCGITKRFPGVTALDGVGSEPSVEGE
jgi:hypothetical protein